MKNQKENANKFGGNLRNLALSSIYTGVDSTFFKHLLYHDQGFQFFVVIFT